MRSTSGSNRVLARGSAGTSFTVQRRNPSATRLKALDEAPLPLPTSSGGGAGGGGGGARAVVRASVLDGRGGGGGATAVARNGRSSAAALPARSLGGSVQQSRGAPPAGAFPEHRMGPRGHAAPPPARGLSSALGNAEEQQEQQRKPDSAPAGGTKGARSAPTRTPHREGSGGVAATAGPREAFREGGTSGGTREPQKRMLPSTGERGSKGGGSHSEADHGGAVRKGYGAAPPVRASPAAAADAGTTRAPARQRAPPSGGDGAAKSPKAKRELAAAALLSSWPPVPPELASFLDSSQMEPPFSGEYHRLQHASDDGAAGARGEGYYVCVRCAIPLFSARSKLVAPGGYAAFQRCNARALRVALSFAGSDGVHGGGDGDLATTRYLLRCARCDAFIGKLAQESVGAAHATGEVHRVNSCSVRFIDSAQYPAVDTTLGAEEEEGEEGEEGEEASTGKGSGDDDGSNQGVGGRKRIAHVEKDALSGDLDGLTREEFVAQQLRIAAWGASAKPTSGGSGGGGPTSAGRSLCDDSGSGNDYEGEGEEGDE